MKAETFRVIDLTKLDEITFKDNTINLSGKLLGKFEVKSKDINESNKVKTTIYEVTVFDEDGSLVARLDLQVVNNLRKNSLMIDDATLKTIRDNVAHNPSNFINYEENLSKSNSGIPQFENVIKYLLSYNYL